MALYNAALLAAWREETGLTRERVCTDITEQGVVSIGYIWLTKLETGRGGAPSLAVLDALARYYGHAVHELLVPAEAAS